MFGRRSGSSHTFFYLLLFSFCRLTSNMAEIPFWVHDRPKWVSGISKSTTCQDVLQALVLAERKGPQLPAKSSDKANAGSKDSSSELTPKEVSKGLALVEQWRGVERPLSNSSKILKLWLAWGEERSQVRFVVKRISATSSASSSGGPAGHSRTSHGSAGQAKSSRPARRRNSRASITSEHKAKKASDTVHPNALKHSKNADLERLMRIILTQGETIHWQLKKLQERECQIECIEQEVHNSRTKTAGKDYLLNAYLSHDHKQQQQQQQQPSSVPPSNPSASSSSSIGKLDIEATAEGIQEILEALSAVFKINEQITEAEEQVSELNHQLTVQPKPSEVKALHSELKDLRTTNDVAGQEIDYNRHLISSMRLAYDERKALMAKLEHDVDTIDLETQKLQQELQALQAKRQEQTFEFLSKISSDANVDDIEDTDEETPIIFSGGFLDDTKHGHYDNILTNEQLYEGPHQEPSALYDELQRRLRIKTTCFEDIRLQSPDNTRIKATGSPGSNSSSGNSSGSGASYEKSVRFSDRELILSTPELPDLPSESSQKAKSILKAGEGVVSGNGVSTGDNTDSNSDTGLSSLHSSSDEGTYVLDTLV